jgi:hypothetical protein
MSVDRVGYKARRGASLNETSKIAVHNAVIEL